VRLTQQTDIKKRGFYGYIIVSIACLVNLIIGGTQYTFGVFFEPLSSEFEWTRAMTSGAFSLYIVLTGSLYIITGKLNDRFGPRIVLTGCGFFLGIGYLLMSRVSDIWHVYLFYGVITAVGMSCGYVPMLSTVNRWFENNAKRGLMIGISIAGIGFGTMIMPPFASWLISSYGWRISYIIIGLIALVPVMTVAQFLKTAPEANWPAGTSGQRMELSGLSSSHTLRTRQFWLLSIAYFGFGIFLHVIMVHIVLHTLGLGISAAAAANIFIVIGGLSLLSRIGMGFISDRIGNKAVMIINFALMVVAFLWLLMARDYWAIIVFAIVFGIAYGGLAATQSPIVADLFGIKSHGAILGIVVFIITIGGAVGPVMAGKIFDSTHSYNWVFIICIAFSITSLLLTIFLKPTRRTVKLQS
jgi:MFS family permease